MAASRGSTTETTGRTVGEVARLAGITVRALHHWDDIGLVVPSGRSEAGYRLYGSEDLQRLHQVLVYRELGFSLERIRAIVDDPDVDRGAALREQRAALVAQADRLARLLTAVDAAITAHQEARPMTDQEIIDALGGFDPSQYEDEVRERWGDTEAYEQSTAVTSCYTADDWRAVRAETDEIVRRLADALAAGSAADGAEAMDAAEAHRQHISSRFYECSRQMHAGLGEMYVADPRFTAYWEDIAPGLAVYARDAFVANAARS